MVPPVDIPEDAEGRVMFIALSPPPDVIPGVEELAAAADVTDVAEPLGPIEEVINTVSVAPMRLVMRGGVAGWTPVLLLGTLFVVVFLVGMRLAR